MITSAHELLFLCTNLPVSRIWFEAMYLDAKEKNDFALFPLVSEGYLHKIRELNTEIREYLQSHTEVALTPSDQLPVRS